MFIIFNIVLIHICDIFEFNTLFDISVTYL